MSDWTWEYSPDAEHVVGDLPEAYRRDVEDFARRIAEAVGVHLQEGSSPYEKVVPLRYRFPVQPREGCRR